LAVKAVADEVYILECQKSWTETWVLLCTFFHSIIVVIDELKVPQKKRSIRWEKKFLGQWLFPPV